MNFFFQWPGEEKASEQPAGGYHGALPGGAGAAGGGGAAAGLLVPVPTAMVGTFFCTKTLSHLLTFSLSFGVTLNFAKSVCVQPSNMSMTTPPITYLPMAYFLNL